MSELIQMRQRIKAIDTIKKITHAMRLISMSSHSRLKRKQEPLMRYINEINTLFTKVYTLAPDWKSNLMNPEQHAERKSLFVLIGSQKGLCGNFNTALFHLFDRHTSETSSYDLIAVGKKTVDYAEEYYSEKLIASYNVFMIRNFFMLAQELTHHIVNAQGSYNSVAIFSNQFVSFFLQKPYKSVLIPFTPELSTKNTFTEDYLWKHKPSEILDLLAHQYLEARIQHIFFDSLFAEHAARFLSMDNATRNAENLLEETKLEYNKLRQAKITKELIELVGSF
jgi:F-type H+-transporting ATPase subunit gamma